MDGFMLSAFADEISSELKTQMDVLDKYNIKYIEMRGVNGVNVVSHSISSIKEIKKQLDGRGFRISAVASPIGKIKITDRFEPHLDLFRHTLEIADILETKYVRMFSFYIPTGEHPDDYFDEIMERWHAFKETAKNTNIVLLHENEKNIYGDTPERCLTLLKEMNSDRIKAVFDPANFIQCDIHAYPYAYNILEDYIVYMHIKDARSSDHSVVPSGYGDGKIRDILLSLRNNNFSGFLSLEPHLGSFVGFSELEDHEKYKDLPEGGEKTFKAAAEALMNILSKEG